MSATEQSLQQQVADAYRQAGPLNIIGGGSKAFYGRAAAGEPLRVKEHAGVVRFEPAELVITARAGTPLGELETVLGEKNQMLGFEPPMFSDSATTGGASATIGGAVAAGLAGPRRPYPVSGGGAVRDCMLGVKMLNGKGEVLRFGGEVMKNVAGFDLTRLQAGAMGALGVLLEVSLRVAPRPQVETTLGWHAPDSAAAVAVFNRLAGRPLPLSAAAWCDGWARIRLSGSGAAVTRAVELIAREVDAETEAEHGGEFWRQLRDHDLPFFATARPLWRASLPPAAEFAVGHAPQLIDWGGAQRWIDGAGGDFFALQKTVANCGGHLTCFRAAASAEPNPDEVFHPLAPPVQALHRRLKTAFDPAGILNPGRMYRGL